MGGEKNGEEEGAPTAARCSEIRSRLASPLLLHTEAIK